MSRWPEVSAVPLLCPVLPPRSKPADRTTTKPSADVVRDTGVCILVLVGNKYRRAYPDLPGGCFPALPSFRDQTVIDVTDHTRSEAIMVRHGFGRVIVKKRGRALFCFIVDLTSGLAYASSEGPVPVAALTSAEQIAASSLRAWGSSAGPLL